MVSRRVASSFQARRPEGLRSSTSPAGEIALVGRFRRRDPLICCFGSPLGCVSQSLSLAFRSGLPLRLRRVSFRQVEPRADPSDVQAQPQTNISAFGGKAVRKPVDEPRYAKCCKRPTLSTASSEQCGQADVGVQKIDERPHPRRHPAAPPDKDGGGLQNIARIERLEHRDQATGADAAGHPRAVVR